MGYEQNQAESKRETTAAVREAHRAVVTANEWLSTWAHSLPDWVGPDMSTVERKLRKINDELGGDLISSEGKIRLQEFMPGSTVKIQELD